MSLDKLFSCERIRLDMRTVSEKEISHIEKFDTYLRNSIFINSLGIKIDNAVVGFSIRRKFQAKSPNFYIILNIHNKTFNKSNFEEILENWNTLDNMIKVEFMKLKYRWGSGTLVYLKLFKEDELR